jgi:hypothetical protein
MLLTSQEYETITSEIAPIAFDSILAMVQGEFDAMTLYYFSDSTLIDAPQGLRDTLKRYLAYKVLGACEAGGVVAGTEQAPQSVSVGKISFSGSKGSNPAADRLLPLLLSYTNGTVTLLD